MSKPTLGLARPVSGTRRALLAAFAAAPLVGCGGGGDAEVADLVEPADAAGATGATDAAALADVVDAADEEAALAVKRGRSWKMGFSRVPPRHEAADQLACLDKMRGRCEFVVLQEQLPWTELLAGVSPQALVDHEIMPLVNAARSRGFDVVFLMETGDGSSRGEEPPALRALGRSLGEKSVQALFVEMARAIARTVRPSVLGLATESNAVRLLGTPAYYGAVIAAASAAAAAVKRDGYAGELMVSIQVEVAHGRMPGQPAFIGTAGDLRDFPFVEVFGFSSYPHYAFALPEEIPADYYSRLLPAGGPKMIVVEGGWPTAGSLYGRTTSVALQQRYLRKQATLLDSVSARGVAQLLIADLDLALWTADAAQGLATFASLGLMGSRYQAKTSLKVWDNLYARKLQNV